MNNVYFTSEETSIIHRLKNNEKPYGLLSGKEHEILKKVGKSNCEYFSNSGWKSMTIDLQQISPFFAENVYRVRQDYTEIFYRENPNYKTPSPSQENVGEFRKCAVRFNIWEKRYYFVYEGFKVPLCNAVDFTNFCGYEYADGQVLNSCLYYDHPIARDYNNFKIKRPVYVLFQRD
jgi:hypothetical protein